MKNDIKDKMHLERVEYWKGLISEWEKSALTKFEFCKRKKITHSGFYLWYKRLRSISFKNEKQVNHKKHNPKNKISIGKEFIPVKIASLKKNSCFDTPNLRFELPNGIKIMISDFKGADFLNYVKLLKEI
jgi:hypothetical protein